MIVLAAVPAAAWLWLLFLRGGFWRTSQRLPARTITTARPSVGIVVPARDEAAMIRETLPALLAQDYSGPVRILLVDDGSSDGTGDIARSLTGPIPLEVSSPGPPPRGWAGKLWAVDHGVQKCADCEFLLFTDADIRHDPDSLSTLVDAAGSGNFALVSQMARLRTKSFWERLIVPAFVYFFGLLYPFRWINSPTSRTAAAAGGCVLVRTASLREAGGISAIHDAIIDDVALGTLIKRAGGRIWLGLADRVHSVRPYPGLASLWRMVARSAYAQLRYSPLLLAGSVLGLTLIFLVPPALLVAGAATGDLPTAFLGGFTWLLMAAMYAPMLRYYGQPVAGALLLPAVAILYTAMTVDSARGRGTAWKGRTDPSRAARRRTGTT